MASDITYATTVPDGATLVAEESVVSLPRYAQIVQSPECAFFGVSRSGETQYACRRIWTKQDRDMIARYLAEAQEELENEINYFLMPRWVVGVQTDTVPERQIDQQVYGYPLWTRWGHVIEAGVRATVTIATGAAVDHAADPAVIGPLAMAAGGGMIRVYHPGTTVEITPSSITIVGTNLTITIPRCRMVLASLANNPEQGIGYANDANFEQTVDVIREYTDGGTNATLVWPHQCNAATCSCTCDEYTQCGCMYVSDPVTGLLEVLPATYAEATGWTARTTVCCTGEPSLIRLNYRAGVRTLTQQQEDAIVRLAHTKMPDEPCGCEIAQGLWKRDRHVPDVMTAERASCPFGMMDGAWVAWRFAQTFRLLRGMVM